MENKLICAVTGKNIFEIGNGQSETNYKNMEIKRSIAKKVTELIESGVTDFLCNAEQGFPLWASEIILNLRDARIKQGLSSFRLHIVMPHEEQANDWNDDVHERFFSVHENADEVLILHRRFNKDCYENCERFMIDQCDVLFTDDESYFAAQYAELHNKRIVVCKESSDMKQIEIG